MSIAAPRNCSAAIVFTRVEPNAAVGGRRRLRVRVGPQAKPGDFANECYSRHRFPYLEPIHENRQRREEIFAPQPADSRSLSAWALRTPEYLQSPIEAVIPCASCARRIWRRGRPCARLRSARAFRARPWLRHAFLPKAAWLGHVPA